MTVFPGLSYQEGKFPQWGFLCAKVEDEQAALHSKFKLLLEKAVCDSVFANWPRGEFAHEDVKSWYRVYLKGLYSWIQGSLEAVLMEKHNIIFQDHRVIYTFSVPTTWSPEGSTVSLFRKLIHEAGFGKLPNHSFRIGLTEAEAAAVSTMMDPTSGDYVPEFHVGPFICSTAVYTTRINSLWIGRRRCHYSRYGRGNNGML